MQDVVTRLGRGRVETKGQGSQLCSIKGSTVVTVACSVNVLNASQTKHLVMVRVAKMAPWHRPLIPALGSGDRIHKSLRPAWST